MAKYRANFTEEQNFSFNMDFPNWGAVQVSGDTWRAFTGSHSWLIKWDGSQFDVISYHHLGQ